MGANPQTSIRDGVAHVVLDAGPSARLTTAWLTGIQNALAALADDDTVTCVVLSGSDSGFPSGITAPAGGGDDFDNLLADVCLTLEAFSKPVIVALTGAVVGGGAELALAAHYRLAHADARIGFPNARLGLVPNAGATQRLPRLAGAGVALDLLLRGQLVSLASDTMKPLVDHVFEGTIKDGVDAFLVSRTDPLTRPRPTANLRVGFTDTQAFQTAIATARKSNAASPEIAKDKILSAVEASILLPMSAGLAFEDAAAEDCANTDQARALSHVFQAEQSVAANTRRRDLPTLEFIGVLGGGQHATQIVMALLASGLKVQWLIRNPDQQRDSVGYLQTLITEAVRNGRIGAEHAKSLQSGLRFGDGPETLDGADIILRAARGQRGITLPVTLPVIHCLPGTDPHLLLKFSHPIMTSPLAELCFGPESPDADRRSALALMQRLSKLTVIQTTEGPTISDRLMATLWRAADALVDTGQSPFGIDTALRNWGMAHPPFEQADIMGLAHVARQDRAAGCHNWSRNLVNTGRQGRPTEQGFYRYDATGAATADPEVAHIINTHRAAQSALREDQIVRLILGAVANEGAILLREQAAARAGDIDVVSVLTHLVPRTSGGILHTAGALGLLQTVQAMEALDHPDRALWTPDPVFRDLIKNGRRFDDL